MSGVFCWDRTLGVDTDRFILILACDRESFRSLKDIGDSCPGLMSMADPEGCGTP